jgi:hypothetical protein
MYTDSLAFTLKSDADYLLNLYPGSMKRLQVNRITSYLKTMQLQLEYNSSPFQNQQCLICKEQFKTTEAKILVCNNQGYAFGEACPNCLKEGFNWISDRFEQLDRSKKRNVLRHSQRPKVPVGA